MGVSDEEWKKLDQKAKSTIRLCVSDLVLLKVSRKATAKALWDKLGNLYQSKSLVNKLFLQKKLYNLRMKDGDSVTEHLNAFNIVFDEIVTSLLTEEMRRKNMESQNGDALLKEGHYKRDCKSKAPDKEKGFDDAPSAEVKTTADEYVDVYLASSRDDRKARIVGHGKVKLNLEGGRVRTLTGVLHIPALAKNLISISKMDDAGVKTMFEKDTYKMVRGEVLLMWGVQIGNLYKLQGSTVVNGCNSFVVPESGVENLVVSGEKTVLFHQRLGHIGEKGL
eukprot:PITA_05572